MRISDWSSDVCSSDLDLATILDHRRPRLTGLDGGTQITKRLGWHIGMANDVLRLAKQLLGLKAADFHERGVAVADLAFQVGNRDDGVAIGKGGFVLGNRQILAHAFSRLDHSWALEAWNRRRRGNAPYDAVDKAEIGRAHV